MTADAPVRTRFSPTLTVFAWLSFLSEVLIVATGGTVRLTSSGLGCSDWPLCTPGSLVPTQELGIHGLIEFGNRTMTGAVGILAIVVLLLTLGALGRRRDALAAVWFAAGGLVLAVIGFAIQLPAWIPSAVLLVTVIVAAVYSLRTVPVRRDLSTLAWVVLAGVMSQAVVGGFAVLTELNAFLVGFHYVVSLLLVCVTAAFLVRLRAVPGPRERAVPLWYLVLAHVTSLVLAVTVVFGVLTTANGPHSGDDAIVRNGFDATIMAHVHSIPGYTLAVLTIVLVAAAWTLRLPTRGWLVAFVVALLAQIGVGVWQANSALPPLLVGTHMVIAALLSAAYVVVILRLKRPVSGS
ncbi:COX15/CtaA family protein [Microbacterium indicum]|uniref:COX15/CtaA family protein n=1 Tax=Microbacterium indicum TaxID=358100 RepID=UPI0003F6F332|nr:COX15/CtaA family protein [Microbacterium indicum]